MAELRPFIDTPARDITANSGANHPDANYYNVMVRSGATTALSAADTVLSFRTGTGSGLWVINQIRASVSNVVGFASAKIIPLELYIARSFTVSDTGGTAVTLSGNVGKLKTSDVTTTVSDIRVANTSTLTAGTRTLDAIPNCAIVLACSVTANSSIANGTTMIATSSLTMSQLMLSANEGFVVQVQQSYPATGTWLFNFVIEWFEVPQY